MVDGVPFKSTPMDRTPLIYAAESGDMANIERFLSFLNSKDNNGQTALMFTVINQHKECISYLIDELPLKNNNGCTALDLAVQYATSEIVETLLCCGRKKNIDVYILARKPRKISTQETSLIKAVRLNDESAVIMHLAECGLEYNGCTALRKAALYGHTTIIPHLLIESGICNNRGYTALMAAAQNGHLDAVRMLIHEAHIQNADGWSALMWATHCQKEDCLDLLLCEAGLQTTTGLTALMLAAKFGFVAGVRKLFHLEANIRDNNSMTALVHAIRSAPPNVFSSDYNNIIDLLIQTEVQNLSSEEIKELIVMAQESYFDYASEALKRAL